MKRPALPLLSVAELTTSTLLFTDLVASTSLRARLGDDAADRVHAEHDRVLRDALGAGREVKMLGDGLMAAFPSAADALQAAVRIQEGIAALNQEQPEVPLEVRVGVNSGEVSLVGGDYSGLPVVLARRACERAGGGQILTTGLVRSLVGSRGGFRFLSQGPLTLKGMAEPVELWELDWRKLGDAIPLAPEAPIPFPAVLARAADTSLVGRDQALRRLDSALELAQRGERQMVLVSGEPGIGKSALAAVWARRAAEGGARVLAGRSPAEAVTSYQPFVEAVRPVALARPDLIARAGPGAHMMVRLLPDLAERLPRSAVQADPGTERYLLFEGVVALLGRLAEEGPVILVLDDLHWADAPSVALVVHLARHPDQSPLLVVGTYRDTELTTSHPLANMLGELRRERRFERITLEGLDATQVSELVTGLVGKPAPPEVASSIYAETEGNPFFVEEVVAHLREVGALDPSGDWSSAVTVEEWGIPEGLREVIGRRLQQLEEPAARVMGVAAVMGRGFDLDLLEQVTYDTPEVVENAVDRAVSAQLLVESGGPHGRFAFSHALIRQTLYEDLPPTRRIRTHSRVAEVLAAAGAPPGELAHHWAAGHDLPRALQASLAAATAAEEVFAFDDARRHLDLALEVWSEVKNAEVAASVDRIDVLRRAAEMWFLTEDNATAIALIERAIAEVDPREDPLRAGLLFERLARYCWVAGRGEAALSAGEEAVRLIPAAPASRERATAVASVAGILMLAGQFDEARRHAEEAIALARMLGDRKVEGHALTTLGTIEGSTGEFETGVAHIRAGRVLAEAESAIDDLMRTYANVASTLDQGGRLREAAEEALAGVAVEELYGLHGKYGFFQTASAAGSLIRLGEWEEADRLLDFKIPKGTWAVALFSVFLQRMTLAVRRGRFEEARALHCRLVEVSRESIDPQFVAPVHAVGAELAVWEGRLEEGLAMVHEGITMVEGTLDWYYSIVLYPVGLAILAELVIAAPQRAGEWRRRRGSCGIAWRPPPRRASTSRPKWRKAARNWLGSRVGQRPSFGRPRPYCGPPSRNLMRRHTPASGRQRQRRLPAVWSRQPVHWNWPRPGCAGWEHGP